MTQSSNERKDILSSLILGDVSFSSDNIFGISGQKKPLSKEQDTQLRHSRVHVIKELIEYYALDGSDLKEIITSNGLKDWQRELLSESIKDTIMFDGDDSIDDIQKASLLLSRPESSEMMARDIFDINLTKENQLLLEKMPTIMNNNIAIAVLNGVHTNPNNFFGKGLYGKDANEVSENLCKFIFNQGSETGKQFSEMHNFQGWIEALERAGFDKSENKFKNGISDTKINFIEAKIEPSPDKPSITGGAFRKTTHHDDLSKKIHEMESELGLRADIILTRYGKYRQNKKLNLAPRIEEKIKKKLSPDDFDYTEFRRKRSEFETSIYDEDIKKIVFRDGNGRPVMETIGNNGVFSSRGVQLADATKTKPIETNTARLMVLQFTKMNPLKNKLVINPPKNCDPDIAKKFIDEIIKQAVNLGYEDDAIKITCGKGCPLTVNEISQIRERSIIEAKSIVPDASLTAVEQINTKLTTDAIEKDYSSSEESILKVAARPTIKI